MSFDPHESQAVFTTIAAAARPPTPPTSAAMPLDQSHVDFNDLSSSCQTSNPTPVHNKSTVEVAQGENETQPRAKRIACVLCRKRKLRCDGARPKCATCNRLDHQCNYDEVRKKSGPKRGYVKLLEARLQQVETLLQRDDTTENNGASNYNDAAAISSTENMQSDIDMTSQIQSSPAVPINKTELISLGLEEPLPPQDVIDDLHDVYFEKLHPSMSMIHRTRYLAAIGSLSSGSPPICLRYIIWAIAASLNDKYHNLSQPFYQRARKYADIDEMKSYGEMMTTLAHCQTWCLISLFEFKHMYFPRAWQDAGRASSLAVMMSLNRIDGPATGVKQCLPPARDWLETEERRRTFWMTFCCDRYASIGTGWAFRLDELDIMTHLPASERAFTHNIPETSCSLEQALSLAGQVNIPSSSSSVILVVCLLGRNLTHLHRPTTNDNEADLNGNFWQRHRRLENLLANISLALPDHLRIPDGLPDPNVIFMNLLLHTAVICLHQAAIYKADQNSMPQSIILESRARCITGASEITRIMKMLSHIDMSAVNPFMAFCLYVAARVFVQYLKWRPDDLKITASLKFLGSAMHILTRKNPLIASFLAQLEVDLEGTGIVIAPKSNSPWKAGNSCIATDAAARTTYMQRPPSHQMASGDNFTPLILHNLQRQTSLQMTESFINGSEAAIVGSSFLADQFSRLPHRAKGQSPLGSATTLDSGCTHTPSTTDVDLGTADNTRSNSYQYAGSNTSFTPPSASVSLDEQQTTAFNSPPISAGSLHPNDGVFFDISNENFANVFGAQLYGSATYGNGLDSKDSLLWDFSTTDMSSGLTPMVQQEWDDMSQAQNG